MKFGNEFWLIFFREYISPKLFAVCPENFALQAHATVTLTLHLHVILKYQHMIQSCIFLQNMLF